MDYHSLPRKQLQALCKKHSIAANSTNVSMADALAALFNVGENTKPSGQEGFQKQKVSSDDDRSESVLTDVLNTPRMNTRGKRQGPGAHMIGSEIIGDSKVKTRTRDGPKNTMSSEAMINKQERLHSSEVDEVVAVDTSSVKARRGRPRRVVPGILSSKKISRRTDSEEENNQASDEGEETVEINDESVEVFPEAMVKGLEKPRYLQSGRRPRKKSGQVEDEKAVAESIRAEDDASKAEVTPSCRRSTRAKATKVGDGCPVATRSSARKKAGNVDSVKKMPETSSMMSPATKTRRSKMPSDNEDADYPVEKGDKVSSKKKSMAKTPVRARRMLRSCPRDSEESLTEGVLEEYVGKTQETSTHQVQNPAVSREQAIVFKKQAAENRRNVAHTCMKECQVLAVDMKVENVKQVGEEMHVDVASREKIASEEANGGVKGLIQDQKMSRSRTPKYHGPAVHLFEESACKVKQIRTRRGQNPVQTISEAVDSEKQGQLSSELITARTTEKQQAKVPSRCTEEYQVAATDLKGKPVKGVAEDELSIYREAVEHFESVDIDGGNLVAKPKLCEYSNEKTHLQNISEAAGTEQVDYKSMVKVPGKSNYRSCVSQSLLKETCHSAEMNLQNELQVEDCFKERFQDVCLHEEEPHKVMWSESSLLEHQTLCMAEEGSSVEEMARDGCASSVDAEDTHTIRFEAQDLESSAHNNDKSQETEDKDGIGDLGRIQESNFWEQQTVCMPGERTCAKEMEKYTCASSGDGKDTCTSSFEAEDLGSSAHNKDKSQETEDKDGIGNLGGIQESNFLDQLTVCMPGERTCARQMERDTCASSGEAQGLEASILTDGKSQEIEGEDAVRISTECCVQEKAELMYVEFNAEADVAYPNSNSSRNAKEVKCILAPYVKRSKDLDMQQLDPCGQLSFSAKQAMENLVSGRTEFLDIDMIQNFSEAQDQAVTELDNVTGQQINSSEEEYLDTKTVSSNDFNSLGDQCMPRNPVGEINDIEVGTKPQHMNSSEEECLNTKTVSSNDFNSLGDQCMPRNPVYEINDNAGQAKPQVIFNISFLIDDVHETISSDFDNTEEDDERSAKESKDCVHAHNTLEKDQDALDHDVEGQHNWPNCSFSISAGVTGKPAICKEAVVHDGKSEVQDCKDFLFVGESQGSICPFEDGKQNSVHKQLVIGTQNCGLWQPTEEGRHTSGQVSDGQTLIADQETCKMEDVGPVSWSIANIELLKLKGMTTIETSVSKNQIEDQIACTVEKQLPEMETQGVEHAILEMEFPVETNDDDKNSSMLDDTEFLGNPVATCEMDCTESSPAHPSKALCLGKPELAILSDMSPCLNPLDEEECNDIKCTSFDEKFRQLTGNEEGLTKASLSDHTSTSLIEKPGRDFHREDDTHDFFPTEGCNKYMKWPGKLSNMSIEIPPRIRGQEESTVMDDGYLDRAGCKLQVQSQEKICATAAIELLCFGALVSINDQRPGTPSSLFRGTEPLQVKDMKPLDLNALSLRKLRALCKKQGAQIKEAEKVGKRPVLQELSSSALDQRENLPGKHSVAYSR